MSHLVLQEAIKRNRKVGFLIIDLEAQYTDTIIHIEHMIDMYKDNIELHWICAELLLRNAVSNYEPRWVCWDESKKDVWVRNKPKQASDLNQYDLWAANFQDSVRIYTADSNDFAQIHFLQQAGLPRMVLGYNQD